MSFFKQKKVISTLLVSTCLLLTTNSIFADTSTNLEGENTSTNLEVTDDASTYDASTAYKYWVLKKSTNTGSRFVGNEQYLTSHYVQTTGNKVTATHSQGQKGSISVGISVAASAIGASIGYTPGTSKTVSVSTTSNRYKAGTTVKSYYRLREDIFKIDQAEYERLNINNTNKPTGRTKSGTVYKPAAPSIRFSPAGY